jgi:outer membrane protein assembly factor BamB
LASICNVHFNQSERIINTTNVSHLIPYWSTSHAAINSSPTEANGMVYIGSNDKAMYALDENTGKILWAHNFEHGVGSSPAVANGIVYVGSDDNSLYAFNARTGATVWIYTTGGPVWSYLLFRMAWFMSVLTIMCYMH